MPVDNSIKTEVRIYFDVNQPFSLLDSISRAIRISHIGDYGMEYTDKATNRGKMNHFDISRFVEGTMDAYRAYKSGKCDTEEKYFYIRNNNICAFFTHDKNNV